MSKKSAVLVVSAAGETVAALIVRNENSDIYRLSESQSLSSVMETCFHRYDLWIFIGATGICVRAVAPCLQDKHTDPAVVCIDTTGRWVVPVVSGHVGGANEAALRLAALTGGEAVITTQSDNAGLWPLDTLGSRFGWYAETTGITMNRAISLFVSLQKVALFLDIRDQGTAFLERTLPEHVTPCYRLDDIPSDASLLIAVTPRMVETALPLLHFVPKSMVLGVGCRRNCAVEGIADGIESLLRDKGVHPRSVAKVSTVTLKADEPLVSELCDRFGAQKEIWESGELAAVEVPNPSERVAAETGSSSVAEAAAILGAHDGDLLIPKQKGKLLEGADFTFALAEDAVTARRGFIDIVGAGPGDPDLISVRGRRLLEQADLILYAGSLVPREVTACAKAGAEVTSSASLTLEEQFALMKSYYDRGLSVVRLHTGDPCIYGAIQEQMNFFDRYGMHYRITPGISSFQAAAAELRSQFTIPEKVQSIILTRGEGRTPMPEREKLHLLAQSQSTMCIFLSAGIVDEVQRELLVHYPPETPVAVCHHLTWKDQRIWRGRLQELADIVKRNRLTLTTMIVVGEAIDNRNGLSRLYAHDFKHLFRS